MNKHGDFSGALFRNEKHIFVGYAIRLADVVVQDKTRVPRGRASLFILTDISLFNIALFFVGVEVGIAGARLRFYSGPAEPDIYSYIFPKGGSEDVLPTNATAKGLCHPS